ncbi:probable 28S ribosomal protein S23, mitochondrial [Schistocerca americana]|uniref:probable 28S ribosomal protein S23, mitochondrial n=1 Tax=Schistocerca americana TaxID=7009 RepID=UPI001F4F3BAA|nr:probable 28S ribosomal protein S23, mitochondrial [Schistocerca americana]
MASSRLEKVGTIYSRVTGLLKSGAMKNEDRPIWYDVYKSFPPKYEPTFSRPAPNVPIRNIFYPEDNLRARFHKEYSNLVTTVNIADESRRSMTQKFLSLYKKLEEEGNTAEEDLFLSAVELLEAERESRVKQEEKNFGEGHGEEKSDLVSSFKAAQREMDRSGSEKLKLSEILKE